MIAKNEPGSADWTDPDDAPDLTAEMLGRAEVFNGNTFVRRGRGRPPTGNAKEQVSIRLDQQVLAKLRAAGPGWQSQVNGLLRAALGLDAAPTAKGVAAGVVVGAGVIERPDGDAGFTSGPPGAPDGSDHPTCR